MRFSTRSPCAPQPGQNHMAICVDDDDAFVGTATLDLLSSLGHEAVAFESAEDYLNSEQVNDTLCLILDHHLPGRNGLELQNQLLADGFSGSIIFITAAPDSKNRQRALSAGATAYLTKPYDDKDLVLALRTAMRSPSRGAVPGIRGSR
jgi:FixJ family two-component response regulator